MAAIFSIAADQVSVTAMEFHGQRNMLQSFSVEHVVSPPFCHKSVNQRVIRASTIPSSFSSSNHHYHPPPLNPQARKMGQGACRSLVAFYQGVSLVHLNLPPLVLTFAARGSASVNVGAILDSYDTLEEALRCARWRTGGERGPGGLVSSFSMYMPLHSG